MGIIQQQTIKGSFYSYLGILIGVITIQFIQPHVLTPEQIGLTSILTYFSQMFAQFSILGFNGTARYFPYFRDEKKNHNGYLFLICSVSLIGFLLFALITVLLKDVIINQETQKSTLFEEYYWYLLPLTFFTLFFNVFDIYSQRLYDTITGRILNEFVKRVFVLAAILFIAFKLLSFDSFMQVWLLANVVPTIMIAYRLYSRKQLILKPALEFLDKPLKQKLLNMSLFAILTGSAPLIIQNIDTFMINERFGLSNTGIYNIAFYFGTVITLPARSLYPIAYTIIADSWKTNDLANIRTIYRKSCVNQLIAAVFLFIIIWANVDSILMMLPPEYAAGKYVIFFIGLAWVIDSATGTNGVIMATSQYFKYDSLFHFLLIGVAVGANLYFIPRFGITGAAIAFAVTLSIFNLFRFIFILLAFKMQPFSLKNVLVVITGLISYYLCTLIPEVFNTSTGESGKNLKVIILSIGNIGLKAAVVTPVFLAAIHFLNLSEDISGTIKAYLNKVYSSKKPS